MRPFPFIGAGSSSSKSATLWLVSTQASEALVEWLQAQGAKVRAEGRAVEVRFARAPEALEAVLLAAHAVTPLGLAVRVGRVKASAWHRESLADPRVFQVLGALVRERIEYLRPRPFELGGSADVTRALYDGLKGQAPRAEALAAALQALLTAHPGRARAVLADQFLEQLVPLRGFDFDADLVLLHCLSTVQGLSPSGMEMPAQFTEAIAKRLKSAVASSDWRSDGALDWSKVDAVMAALAAQDWRALADGLRETEASHVATLLALPPEALQALAQGRRTLATRIANAGTLLASERRFADALRLFDAAVEGELPAMACATPLYAVQDDNHHLGVDEARSRRYLERCLPHGPKNPTVFLNASFVCMELREPERALALLAEAKAHGVKVAQHRNEGLFAPLRERPEFQALMGR